MRTLSATEAADLLHMNVKQVQNLARAGRLPAVRVGRRWLFPLDRLQRLLGGAATLAEEPAVEISARNRLRGRITALRFDGLMAEVQLRIGDQDLVALITRSSAERLRLEVGGEAFAIIKATEVMIGRGAKES